MGGAIALPDRRSEFERQTAPLTAERQHPPSSRMAAQSMSGAWTMVSAHAMGCAMNSRQLARCQRPRGGETASGGGYRGPRLPS